MDFCLLYEQDFFLIEGFHLYRMFIFNYTFSFNKKYHSS